MIKNNQQQAINNDIQSVVSAVQEGEFDIVRDYISTRSISVNSVDEDGCTLLHWAAINNRCRIAQYLIENGLVEASGGGVLFETPLQWAIRKKYYFMADLIFHKVHCDLTHKSLQGTDALFIACKLGKKNHLFICISWNKMQFLFLNLR
jgi:ankyrin repeat protein